MAWSQGLQSVRIMAVDGEEWPAVEAGLHFADDGGVLLKGEECAANYPPEVGLHALYC